MTDINKEVADLKSQITLLENQMDEIYTQAQKKINELKQEKEAKQKALDKLENEKKTKEKKDIEAKKLVDESKEIVARIEVKAARIKDLFR